MEKDKIHVVCFEEHREACVCILGPLPQWGGLSLVRGFRPPPSSIHLSSWASASSPSHSFIHMFSQEQCSGFPERILHTQRNTVLNIESHTDTNTHMYEGMRTHALMFFNSLFYIIHDGGGGGWKNQLTDLICLNVEISSNTEMTSCCLSDSCQSECTLLSMISWRTYQK